MNDIHYKNRSLTNKPFFNIKNKNYDFDGDMAIKHFISEIKLRNKENAIKYFSKNFLVFSTIDFNQLYNVFNDMINTKTAVAVRFTDNSKIIKTTQIIPYNSESNKTQNRVYNIYLVKEPDKYSNWKICSIETE